MGYREFSLYCLLLAVPPCQKSTIDYLDATKQDWSGGAVGTYGTYYKIYFRQKELMGWQPDSLWVDGRRLPVARIESEVASDTILILANWYRGIRNWPSENELANSTEAVFPFQTDAEGILRLTDQEKEIYVLVRAFRRLQPIAYP